MGYRSPEDPQLDRFCSKPNISGRYSYDAHSHMLKLMGKMETAEYRELLQIYPGNREVHERIKSLCQDSQKYLSDDDLTDLEMYVKRIRGEILFARGWLLCEGPSEYILLRYFAKLLSKALDDYGISIIDFQNNGSPGAFVALASAFEIPWMLVCDGDDESARFVSQIKNRGIEEAEIARRVTIHDSGEDLELFLIRNGFEEECIRVVNHRGIEFPLSRDDPYFESRLADAMRRDKVQCATDLVGELMRCGADATRVPEVIRQLIDKLTGEVN